jgi:predicted amidohydrolase YtcJ
MWVGDELPMIYDIYPIIDLEDQVIMPSFADTHMHFASYATFHAGLNVSNAKSNEEILDMLREFVKTCKDPLVIAFGASPYSVAEQHLVTRAQLDDVCPHKPVFFIKYDGHACVVNTKLLEKIKDKTKDLRGYHEDSGEMNQDAFFEVSNYVTNSISIPKLLKNMQTAVNDLAKKGIGMIHTVSGVGFTLDLDVDMERWFAKGLDNGMQMRVFMQTLNVDDAKRRKLPRIGGCFKAALDGCFGSADAALNEPYENSEDRGVLYYSDEEVVAFCREANEAGLQIEMHAIGDAAFDQATRALKVALDAYPREDHRHAIIHACLPTKEGLKICEDYNILLPIQSAFIDWPLEPTSYLESILGERANQLNPLKTFLDHHIIFSAGSDAPCTEPDPILWIHNAVNHENPEFAISLDEALKMVTYNGYYMTFDEKERGSLERGKIADMVILSKNPYAINKEELKTIEVKELLLQGKPYQPIQTGPIKQILKGIFKRGAKA